MQGTGERESRRDRYRRIRSRAAQHISNGADYIRGLVPPAKGRKPVRPEGIYIPVHNLKMEQFLSESTIDTDKEFVKKKHNIG